MPRRRPKKQRPPPPPLSGSVISGSGLGGGQVLTFRNPTPPKAEDILELVQTAEIEWNLNFGYLRFTKELGGEGTPEIIELANWIEEILEIEIVQFVMMPGTDISFVVRKKRK